MIEIIHYACSTFSDLISLRRPLIMGIINVSPESFAGNYCFSVEHVLETADKMLDNGVDIIDIGAVSTAPNVVSITCDEEWARLRDIIAPLSVLVHRRGKLLSICTSSFDIMQRSITLGGCMMINSVSHPEDEVLRLWARYNLPVVVTDSDTDFCLDTTNIKGFIDNIVSCLNEKIYLCRNIGISCVLADPGIGYHNNSVANVHIVKNIQFIVDNVDAPVIVGLSRKGFIRNITKEQNPEKRLIGSICLNFWAMQCGVSVVRVHDVKETWQALQVWQTISVEE